MKIPRIRAALIALAGAGVLIAAPAALGQPLRPHLVPLLPTSVGPGQSAPIFVDPLEQPGHLLYRFDSVIQNNGGALDLFVASPSSATTQNDVKQALWDGGVPNVAPQDPNANPTALPGATVEDRTASFPGATMLYDPDPGHHHWHFLQAAEYSLLVPHEPPRGSGKVVGFCMVDSYDPGGGVTSYYPEGETGSLGPNRTWCQYWQSPQDNGVDPPIVRGGISPGWGDLYESQDAGQWIDVTGLAPGTYTLTDTVNPNGYIDVSPPMNGDNVIQEQRVIPGVTVQALTKSLSGGKASPMTLSGSIVGPDIPARVSNTGSCDDEFLSPSTPLAACYRTAQAGGPLTFAPAQPPAHGSVSISSGGGLTATASYTPAAGYSGPDSFTYTASDARGLISAPATVTLTVTSPAPGQGPSGPLAPGAGTPIRPALLAPKRLLAGHRLALTVSLGRKVCGAQVTLLGARRQKTAGRITRSPYRRLARHRFGCVSRARLVSRRLPAGSWSIRAHLRVAGHSYVSAPRLVHVTWR